MGPGAGRLLGVAKMSAKNQVVIPSDGRKKLKLRPGDEVAFIEEGGKIILVKGPVEVKV